MTTTNDPTHTPPTTTPHATAPARPRPDVGDLRERVREVAFDVLDQHRAQPNHSPHCACGWRPSMYLNDTESDRRQLRQHQAEAVTDAVLATLPAPVVSVSAINALLGVWLWDAPSFRADVRIDFREDGSIISATLLNPGVTVTDGSAS